MSGEETIDMLITGHHRLSLSEHYAFANASSKRIIKGKEAIARRESMAKILGNHIKLNIKEMGRIEE
jgi:hypothetical protein